MIHDKTSLNSGWYTEKKIRFVIIYRYSPIDEGDNAIEREGSAAARGLALSPEVYGLYRYYYPACNIARKLRCYSNGPMDGHIAREQLQYCPVDIMVLKFEIR